MTMPRLMNPVRTRLLRALLPLALFLGALPRAQAEDALPLYDVEILVFAALSADTGGERWTATNGGPDTSRALPFSSGSGIWPLIDGPRNLQAISDSMRRSGGYRPLLHWRWRQPGWERGQALPIRIQIPAGTSLPLNGVPASGAALQSAPPILDGTIRVALSRYLHLTADLVYSDPDTGIPQRLTETRRMRSSELHYLDHPRFGVLARITPYEPAAAGSP